MVSVAYLAHDLADAAVHRRVAMMQAGGAAVRLAGMRRGAAPASIGADALDLGPSRDARLGQRAARIALLSLTHAGRLARHFAAADVLLARNLEMLVLAVRCLPRMTRRGRLLRAIEDRLAPFVDLVLTSSPAFIEYYFTQRGLAERTYLVENKVLALGAAAERSQPTPAGPPWRIGWFGALRCRQSFDMLARLAARCEGRIEVVIRGRPSPAVFPDLAAEAASVPHLRYEGPYDGQRDLARIYGEVHFAWCIDFYEEGLNSSWLLPNRLYEGGHHRTPPIALGSVETGRFLRRHRLGVALDGDGGAALENELTLRLGAMDALRYAMQTARLDALPAGLWRHDEADYAALVAAIAGSASADSVATSGEVRHVQ